MCYNGIISKRNQNSREENSMSTSYIFAVSGRDRADYYLECERRRYYLFSTKFDYRTFDYFRNGVRLDDIFSMNRSAALSHLKKRLIKAVHYAETEHRITVLDQSRLCRKRRTAPYYPEDEDIA